MPDSPAAVVKAEPAHVQARRILTSWITSGRLAAGAPINETQLAAQLGVSRTPMREALARLEHDGLVVSDARGATSVAPLTARDAREAFPILFALERLAIEQAMPYDAKQLTALRALNKELGAARTAEAAIDRNEQWHRMLVEPCGNTRLLDMIALLRRQIRRYEHAYFARGPVKTAAAAKFHRAVIDALADHAPRAAADALDEHYRYDLEQVLALLD